MAVLADHFDVIIIGAGIMGSCTAYEAAKCGLSVLLLEQFDFLHHLGSSHGESRTIRYAYPEPYYVPMVAKSFQLWEEAESEIGYRVITKTPHLDLGPADSKTLQSVISSCNSHSIDAQVLNQSQVSEKFGCSFELPDGWIGLASEGGVIKPTKAVAMFQALAIKRGVVLRDHEEVVDIKKLAGDGNGVMVSTVNGRKFLGKKCVVTAGAWTQILVKTVTGLDLPMQPLHTVICYWKIRESYEKTLVSGSGFPSLASYGDPLIYGTPSVEFPGLIKLAMHGGHPCDPNKRTWGLGSDSSAGSLVDPVGKWIEKVMPGCVEFDKPVITQGCLYSMTPDGDFVLDFVGGEFGRDVVVAGGFSGHGFKMGPVVGKILVEMAIKGGAAAAGSAVGVEMKWFAISRFEHDCRGNAKEYED
ncbi:uncharacterized protein A4U43_C05F23920 [Asparagus officinalis]|uniref:sarcosine oxidasee (formaldehyde-forming) n=1 Tax=Asparagus officinalis TaxID=4686 RepID=A0A5P1EWJ1_ASPOF|nr:probable sarcosine oxidase [Asparagus officinalis]ONK69527.1 uncharacterized protein A4U43_C05F23920 [Asparagus officinalis]